MSLFDDEIRTEDNTDFSENNRNDDQFKIFTQHLYDDIFSYIFSEQTKLFLPLINAAFNTNYSNNAPIKVEANNFMPNRKKRIADALVSIEDNLYHFECESKNGEIIIRLEEYDELISSRFGNKTLHTAVVYIRNTKLQDSGVLEDGRTIPYIKVQDYSMQELLDKQLYILLPYYVMRYEDKIKNNSESDYKTIVSDLKCLYNEIENLKENEMLRANDFSDVLCKMCVEMTLRISRNSTFSKYLRKEGAMSMSWMTYEEEIQQAKIEARRETKREVRTAKDTTTISLIKNLMETSQESFDRVCEMLKIPNKDVVRYSKMM